MDHYAINVLLSSGELEQEKQYWLSRLQSELKSEIPADYSAGKFSAFQPGCLRSALAGDISAKLAGMSNHSDHGAFIILLSAVMYVLYRYGNSSEVLLGTPVLQEADREELFGNRFLPLVAQLDETVDFIHWVNTVKATLAEANRHGHFPLEHVWRTLHEAEDSMPEMFQTLVLAEPIHDTSCLEEERWGSAFCFFKEAERWGVAVHYNTVLYSEETIRRVVSHIEHYLATVLANPRIALADIDILSPDEKRELLFDFNATAAAFAAHKKMHQLFEESAERQPDGIALRSSSAQLTYRELNGRANQLARLLRQHGVAAGDKVAIVMDRSFEMIAGLLAILKAGAVYVPMEESWPVERVKTIFLKLGIRHALIMDSQNEWLGALLQELPLLQSIFVADMTPSPQAGQELGARRVPCRLEQLSAYSPDNLQLDLSAQEEAYIIFTSGSTGEPKGVLVHHDTVINVVEWVNQTFAVGEADQLLFVTSLCFDLSVYDVFGMLAAGGCIRVASREEMSNPFVVYEILCREPITFWDSAPAALQQILNFAFDTQAQAKLRLVFLSGDWIPLTLPPCVRRIFPHARVISLGGATEATIWSNYFPIDDIDPRWASIPYGKPIQNACYYILDSKMRPCPKGVPGKLYIGGNCLAAGYVNDELLTNRKFTANPFIEGGVMYDTGDMARWMPDGNMEFLGRLDHQVKIRGYRIELGEIEMRLSSHPAVQECTVIEREDSSGGKHLCAYFVAEESIGAAELRSHVATALPKYMVPSYFVPIDEMPVTPNGKLDRKALPAPEAGLERETVYEAPRDELENALTAIWEDVLGIRPIGIADRFEELGGHSLKATALVSQIHKELQLEIPLWQVFQSPTIKELAEVMRQMTVEAG